MNIGYLVLAAIALSFLAVAIYAGHRRRGMIVRVHGAKKYVMPQSPKDMNHSDWRKAEVVCYLVFVFTVLTIIAFIYGW